MRSFTAVTGAGQRPQRGEKPSLGYKRRDVVDRVEDDALRSLRAAVFDTMVALLRLVWRPLTPLERKHKQRSDPDRRQVETELELMRQQGVRWDVQIEALSARMPRWRGG
ncbi:hypothetical protein OAO87_00830 [bacterium]|nr:hypothetical protein [bacterium]